MLVAREGNYSSRLERTPWRLMVVSIIDQGPEGSVICVCCEGGVREYIKNVLLVCLQGLYERGSGFFKTKGGRETK